MRKKIVLFAFVLYLFLLLMIPKTQLVKLASANPEEIHEPTYSGIAEYYDNRTAVVTLTADDWYNGTRQAFEDMCSMLTAKKIYHTGGIWTSRNPDWTQIQYWLDQGYTGVASHSRTHPHIPYDDYDSEIGGSRDDIIGNLTLPPNFSFSDNEYVYTWIEPFGESDSKVRQKLGSYGYLADRDTTADNGWAAWDFTNGLFDHIGYSIRIGSDGVVDVKTLNDKFDSVYNARGIYHLMCHPSRVNWEPNQYADSHTNYIGNRIDVWYVSFGLLYLYRWVATQNVVEITSTGSGQNKIFKISMSSANRQDYGARYPVTYVFGIPSSWTSGYVYYRYQKSDPWVLMKNKSSTDFFNGINASRFDFSSHKAYVSVGFGDGSNDIYLQIRSTPIAHDIAITGVTVSPTSVKVGDPVSINVTTVNQGDFSEIFNVIVYYDSVIIDTRMDVSLGAGSTTTLTFTWDTTEVSKGTYTIKAEVPLVPGEEDNADNVLIDGEVIVSPLPVHDITITRVVTTVATPRTTIKIMVDVENQGDFWETFTVATYYDDTSAAPPQTVNDLPAKASITLEFIWDTTGIAKGTYRIKAVASVVAGEEDVADNTYIDGMVKIGSPSYSGGGGGGGNEQPRANFTYSLSYPTDLDTVQFTDESHDSDGSITSWLWDFGDGLTTTEKNPTHRYADDGNYTVTLTVHDDEGARDEITKQIIVLNVPPKADFTINSSLKPASQSIIQFTDRSSDYDGLIVSWHWEFGDGTISTDQNPTHRYENPGTYTIKLTVMDDDGATAEASKIYDGCTPTTIDNYDGSWHIENFIINLTAMDDYSGVQATYYRFNDGSIKNIETDGQPHITIEGNNKLEYWSVDGAGNEETHHIIDVKLDKTAPLANAGDDQSVAQNILVTLDASESFDNIRIINYEWDFGDASKGTGLKTTHTYKESGIFVVLLTVKDAAGNKNTDSVSVIVLKDTDGDGTPDTMDIDDDGDGMSDAWELYYGLDPLNAIDASLDPDCDGLPNLEEYRQGTDPTSYFSLFPPWIIVLVAAIVTIFIIGYAIVPSGKQAGSSLSD